MNKKYNIVILCGADPYIGPGIIALNLFHSLRKDGHYVEIISNQYFSETDSAIKSIANKQSDSQSILKMFSFKSIISKVKKIFRVKTNSKYLMHSINKQNHVSYSSAVLNKLNYNPDVFIYLFSHFFLNPQDLKVIYEKTNSPILFWLMDSEAMTGGCHFTWDCQGFKNNCGSCPGIQSAKRNDKTFFNLKQKREIFQSIDLQPIYATERQRQMLQESSVFKNIKSHKAHIIVEEDKYKKSPDGRSKYNLPSDKKLIFFASQNLEEERKGMRILLNSLTILASKLTEHEKSNIVLIIAGNQLNDLYTKKIQFEYIHLGYLPHSSFPEVMSCIDIFICPSIEDSGPMVINQSLMSGSPVVAFDMGVATDFIVNNKTGYLAKKGDEIDLANGVHSLLCMSNEELILVSENCRKIAIENFGTKSIINQFNVIFSSCMKN
jgi:glycosyltransferase involved in cell wall biosynthesis